MNTTVSAVFVRSVTSIGFIFAASSAFADSTWQMWDNTVPKACSTTSSSGMGNSYSCVGSDINDPTMTVSAWSTTGSSYELEEASVRRYSWSTSLTGTPITGQLGTDRDGNPVTTGYDYGVVNNREDNTSPNHSMDNSGRTDLLALSFAEKTTLTSVSLGWISTDSDISVLKYTGGATNLADAMSGKTLPGLISSGWELVGHYLDVESDSVAPIRTADIATTGGSSWWIVSAFNSSYGSSPAGSDSTSDYVKLLQVAGRVDTDTPPPSNGVPEPGSLALMGAAMMGFVASRRRKQKAA